MASRPVRGQKQRKTSPQKPDAAAAASAAAATAELQDGGAAAELETEVIASLAEVDVVKELCVVNGVTFGTTTEDKPGMIAMQRVPAKKIESFFFGVPRIPPLCVFTGLRTLRLVNQTITSIEGLGGCTDLKELWIAECQVKKIRNLEKLVNLNKLYLYCNSISKIEGLSKLIHLRTLWLSGNLISTLENLEALGDLTELNVAQNHITEIGTSLDGHPLLESINLSGNPISSLREYVHLSRLEGLKQLCVRDRRYAVTPVTEQPNASTHILYHLPALTHLDGELVTSYHLRETLRTIVSHKEAFYRQQEEALQRAAHHLQRQVERRATDTCRRLHQVLKDIYQIRHKTTVLQDEMAAAKPTVKAPHNKTESIVPNKGDSTVPNKTESTMSIKGEQIENVSASEEGQKDFTGSNLDAAGDPGRGEQEGSTLNAEFLRARLSDLSEAEVQTQAEISKIKEWCKAQQSEIGDVHRFREDRLQLGIWSAGSTILEETGPGTTRFSDCRQHITTRCCDARFQAKHVSKVEPILVTKLSNLRLLKQFSDRIDDDLPRNLDADSWLNSRYKCLNDHVQYRFYMHPPQSSSSLIDVADTGCEAVKIPGSDLHGVLLTDDLFQCCCYSSPHLLEASGNRHGSVVVVQVYYTSVELMSIRRRGERSKGGSSAAVIEMDTGLEQLLSPSAMQACAVRCGHDPHKVFVVPERVRVIPAFAIDFSLRDGVVSEISSYLLDDSKSPEVKLPQEELVLQLEACLPESHTKSYQVCKDGTVVAPKATKLPLLEQLDLSFRDLTQLSNVSSLKALRKLIITGNQFSELPRGLNTLEHLKELHADFNNITDMDKLQSMPHLQVFNVKGNRMESWREAVAQIQRCCPRLQQLDLRFNPWLYKPEVIRAWAAGKIDSLQQLDGVGVLAEERTAGLAMLASSQVVESSGATAPVNRAVCATERFAPFTLSLKSVAAVLVERNCFRKLLPDAASIDVTQVTAVCVDGQNLCRLSHFERLVNLKWLSASGNMINRMEPIKDCIKLEELILDDNCIEKLTGLALLSKLKRLSLGRNFIATLSGSGIERAKQLKVLSVASNYLRSLEHLQNLKSLGELFVGDNLLSSMQCVFPIKLLGLKVLDMLGNPFSWSHDNYRLCVLHHMPLLSYLDGLSVEGQEVQSAKEKYGGRVNQDFLVERLGIHLRTLTDISLPSCGLRSVDLGGDASPFAHINKLNLENNNITSLLGLEILTNLKVLCLSSNSIEHIAGKPVPSVLGSRVKMVAATHNQEDVQTQPPFLPKLEILHLAENKVSSMMHLHLYRFPCLRILYLQGNHITHVEGLEHNGDITELVLDRNRIRELCLGSFTSQGHLQNLHLEENRLKSLSHLDPLFLLERLYLGKNQIKEMSEIDKLVGLKQLKEVSLLNNMVANRSWHRTLLVLRHPRISIIDGQPISSEERQSVVQYFSERQPWSGGQGYGNPAMELTSVAYQAVQSVPARQPYPIGPFSGPRPAAEYYQPGLLPSINRTSNMTAGPGVGAHTNITPSPVQQRQQLLQTKPALPFQQGNVGQHYQHHRDGKSNRPGHPKGP